MAGLIEELVGAAAESSRLGVKFEPSKVRGAKRAWA